MIEKKGTATPVRLTEEEKRLLTQIAEETGLTVSTLIRLLINSLVVSYKNNGNSITLPISWMKIVEDHATVLRGRTDKTTKLKCKHTQR